MDPDLDRILQRAFDRMRRGHENATGCRLTAEMLHALSVTFLGEVWQKPENGSPIERIKVTSLTRPADGADE